MNSLAALIVTTVYLSAPAWISNAGAAVFGYFFIVRHKWLPVWPLDGGAHFRGARVLGDSRTLLASVFMLGCAVLVGAWQGSWMWGFMLGLFAFCGTLVNSFIKRRLGLTEGQSFIGDHIDYALSTILGLYVLGISTPAFNAIIFVLWVVTFQYSINKIAKHFGFSTAPSYAKTSALQQ